jgi:hypothetical protein
MEFLDLCATLAAAVAVTSPVGVDARSAVLESYLKTGECAVLPAAQIMPAVTNFHRVREVNDVVIVSGTLIMPSGKRVEFWSWMGKDNRAAPDLRGKAM